MSITKGSMKADKTRRPRLVVSCSANDGNDDGEALAELNNNN
jgi:hypothetical protein